MRQARALICSLAAWLSACGTDSAVTECVSDRDFFEQQVWREVMGNSCIGCHTLAGPAAELQAKLLLQPTAYPGFLDENFGNAKSVAAIEIAGTSALLLKPLGEQNHGGGVVLEQGSPEYKILQEFVERSATPTEGCEDVVPPPLDGVELLDGPHTLRKALLLMNGRLPTQAERDSVGDPATVDTGLDAMLEQAMTEPAFYDWVVEAYNDVVLVDRYLSFTGRAVNLLNTEDWPNASTATFGVLPQLDRERGNLAVTREPVQLIAHIIRENRPFTEILTADYTVVNPWSAQIYGLTGLTFADPTNPNEWQPTKLTFSRAGATITLPHAGVLSSPMWLNRFPSTNTNRNRHRARMVYQQFLATDILAIADRPVDAAESTSYLNPTREDPACKVCHAQIDPIAGSFQKWTPNDPERWNPALSWYPEMYPAGYQGELLDTSEYERALPWLASRLSADPRFPISVTRTVFKALTGQATLEYPAAGSLDFEAHRAAFVAQNAVLSQIAAEFVASNYNFRTVVKGIVKSAAFRATNLVAPVDGAAAIEVGALGTAQFSTPEQLTRKIAAVTGMPWARNTTDRRSQLIADYRIAYGGIDSDLIVDRLRTPNGMMSGVAWRMANEVACISTAHDFTRPPASRALFPAIEITDVPEVDGTPQPGVEAKVRAGLVHLHEQILGETHVADDDDINRAWSLWLETWRETTAANSTSLVFQCRGRWDASGVDLPLTDRIENDTNFTIRAWMAVITYLLADYRFLYQ